MVQAGVIQATMPSLYAEEVLAYIFGAGEMGSIFERLWPGRRHEGDSLHRTVSCPGSACVLGSSRKSVTTSCKKKIAQQ